MKPSRKPKEREWNRDEIVDLLRKDIWKFLTADAEAGQILLLAESLLQMSESDIRLLAQLQFILSDEVRKLLEEMPSLTRRLTNTTTSETEVSAQRVRGPIKWGETYAQRAARGNPNVFVTSPTRRAFNTPENEVLAYALRVIAKVGRSTGWHKFREVGPAGDTQQRSAEALRWLQSRELIDIPAATPSPVTLARVRASRNRHRYQAALDVVRLFERFIAHLDGDGIREAVEHRGLVASNRDVLLELLCAFDTIRWLRDSGWRSVNPPSLIGPALQQAVLFTGARDGYNVKVTYQATPRDLSKGSLYREALVAHGFEKSGALRPDLVIHVTKDGYSRWLLVEVKGGQRKVSDSARDAALDLLGYRRAFSSVLDKQEQAPYGLGYVWGEGLWPSTASDVTLCTPDTLPTALELLLARP